MKTESTAPAGQESSTTPTAQVPSPPQLDRHPIFSDAQCSQAAETRTRSATQPAEGRRRIEWNEHEIASLAKAFVAARLSDPFLSAKALVTKSQTDTLPEHRRRTLLTIPSYLRARIAQQWQLVTAKETAEAPTPVILQVEVPKPFDYVEALESLDSATLVALLMGRLNQVVREFQAQLIALPKASLRGAKPQSAAPPATAPPVLFNSRAE